MYKAQYKNTVTIFHLIPTPHITEFATPRCQYSIAQLNNGTAMVQEESLTTKGCIEPRLCSRPYQCIKWKRKDAQLLKPHFQGVNKLKDTNGVKDAP